MKVLILWSLNFILAFLCLILKKRIRWLSSFFVVIGITFFSLLTPDGKVLWQLWWFKITSGALLTGLFRAGILIFLQLLSKILISSKIKLPGKIGQFVNQVFAIYEKLTAEKFTTKINNSQSKNLSSFMESIDERLINAWNICQK